jgi:hypothetical protein
MTSSDMAWHPDLSEVAEAWPSLSENMRQSILEIVRENSSKRNSDQ